MSNELVVQSAIENALIKGDLSLLKPEERLSYVKRVCDSVGLNMLTRPFEYITLNGKLVLYATRSATDQLRGVHKVSIKITSREKFDDIYVVTAQATNAEGRFDESTGAVNVSGLKGDALANAYLKAETKAKRRVTLSLCGLGLLDESEVETIPDAKPFVEQATTQLREAPKEESKVEPQNPSEYVIKFGKKMAGKQIKDFSIEDHRGMLTWLEDQSKKAGKPISGPALEYFKHAEAFIIEQSKNEPKFDRSENIPF